MRSFRPFPVSVVFVGSERLDRAAPCLLCAHTSPPQLLHLCLGILIVLSSLLLLFCIAAVMTHRYVLATHDREPGLAVQSTPNDNTLALIPSFYITCVHE